MGHASDATPLRRAVGRRIVSIQSMTKPDPLRRFLYRLPLLLDRAGLPGLDPAVRYLPSGAVLPAVQRGAHRDPEWTPGEYRRSAHTD